MSKIARISVLSALLIAVVLAAGFFTWFDRVPYQRYAGYHGEARTNSLLAAQRFLASMGVAAQSFASLQGLPPPGGTLILPTPRVSLSEARNRELLAWVRAGGHLIVVIWTLKDEGGSDPLLDPFGIEQDLNKLDGDVRKISDIEGQVAEAQGLGEPLKVHFHPSYRFSAVPEQADFSVADEFGPHLLSLPVGRGRLTSLTDHEFMENPAIGANDHAALLWQLTRMTGANGPVWLVYAEDLPSLWRLIWQHARPVVWAAAALLAWLIAARSRRFGPLLPVPASARRSLAEHVIASGWFDWRQGHGEAMLTDMRDRVLRRWLWQDGRIDARADWRRLAAAARVRLESLREALEPGAARDEARFTRAVRVLAAMGERG